MGSCAGRHEHKSDLIEVAAILLEISLRLTILVCKFLFMSNSSLSQLRFVLHEPSHPRNVGSVARAMKTMGFSSLYLVNPRERDVLKHPEAIALASGAQDILEAAKVVESISDALQGCDLAAAVSARLREFSPPILDPREFAVQFVQKNSQAGTGAIALIMGNERAGLPNDIVEKCNYLVNIPANPDYSSLNLAQAVQVLAYECRYAMVGNNKLSSAVGFKGSVASLTDVEAMFTHLEQGLIAIEFIDPSKPKKLMTRLRRLFSRTQLEVEEVNILRGIAKKMLGR